jgi:hypothetical protein
MSTALRMKAKKPCDSDCTVLSLSAALEYADGSAADISNGVGNDQTKCLRSLQHQEEDLLILRVGMAPPHCPP